MTNQDGRERDAKSRQVSEEADEMEFGRSPLPEELVEKIMSMLPFPAIIKARVLSKGWYAKFEQNEELGQSAFQRMVLQRSSSWEPFCPAFLKKDTSELIAYNRTSNSWRKMLSLAYLPGDFVRQDIIVEGSLICGTVVPESSARTLDHNLYVTNVLTKAYRVLPLRPNMTYVGCKHLLHRGADGYIVVVFSLDPHLMESGQYTFDAQVYNSKIHAWRTTKVTIENDFYLSPQCSAYLKDTLYIMSRHALGVLTSGQIGMLALNVEDMTWERCTLSFPSLNRPCTSVTLVLCGGQILVVLSLDVEPRPPWMNLCDEPYQFRIVYSNTQQSLVLMKVNLKTRQLSIVTQGPPEALCTGAVHNNPVTDGTYIYFGAKSSSSVVAYNVEKDEWSKIPSLCRAAGISRGFQWSAFPFRPGLNSFLQV
ncbi:hypothetical protein MPTK1_6g08170 [Marchantia polymorpha subsp. ruderalis]|uniref:F-box domain-containing protein n=2 Tax=Marchantia polymorpha TaxID=3197 RepID=A0AAF6BPS6_MARPO|nr:hypothetical protein MARPO_0060s0104 [Marchantia polymorpha]BBN14010.1 hypothetical protein Mp_6g08170 [Marchantia polymorpha subsp. ruderalis]|eukprot:PTQ37035.1 hypothetical protein MARPO_0060s0104 [Marchantia polymorpha]